MPFEMNQRRIKRKFCTPQKLAESSYSLDVNIHNYKLQSDTDVWSSLYCSRDLFQNVQSDIKLIIACFEHTEWSIVTKH